MTQPALQFLSQPRSRLIAGAMAVIMLTGCEREDENVLRDRLAGWFSIGETLSFHATRGCAVGAYRLINMHVSSRMQVVSGVPQVPSVLKQRGAVAVNDPRQAPDDSLIELANSNRSWGMGMRRVALEGRQCMNAETESAFRYALDNPGAIMAYDAEHATFILLDPQTGVLVAVMGSGDWG